MRDKILRPCDHDYPSNPRTIPNLTRCMANKNVLNNRTKLSAEFQFGQKLWKINCNNSSSAQLNVTLVKTPGETPFCLWTPSRFLRVIHVRLVTTQVLVFTQSFSRAITEAFFCLASQRTLVYLQSDNFSEDLERVTIWIVKWPHFTFVVSPTTC